MLFFRPTDAERQRMGRRAGVGVWGGGGQQKLPPRILVPNGGPTHGLHPRFVVAEIWADVQGVLLGGAWARGRRRAPDALQAPNRDGPRLGRPSGSHDSGHRHCHDDWCGDVEAITEPPRF